jgi:hypothetical protein
MMGHWLLERKGLTTGLFGLESADYMTWRQ